jgi:hypothetical protein
MKTPKMITPKIPTQELWRNRFEEPTKIIREGFVSGTLAGAVVALWYLACDIASGRPFHTPALLGAIFFNGLRGHDIGSATLGPVLNFTLLHFAAFIVFGLASAIIIAAAERETLLVLGALVVYACYEICFLTFVAFLDASALGAIGWWKIAVANAITLATVFGYFQSRHPQILSRFSERWAKFDEEQIAAPQVLVAGVIPLPKVRPASIPAGLE